MEDVLSQKKIEEGRRERKGEEIQGKKKHLEQILRKKEEILKRKKSREEVVERRKREEKERLERETRNLLMTAGSNMTQASQQNGNLADLHASSSRTLQQSQ